MEQFTEEQKSEIEKKIVETLVSALDKDEISADDLPSISDFVLGTIDTIKTKNELMQFLRNLSAQWRIFSPLLVLESGEIKEENEGKVAEDVLSLVKSGKVEDAISLAKTMTNTTGGI